MASQLLIEHKVDENYHEMVLSFCSAVMVVLNFQYGVKGPVKMAGPGEAVWPHFVDDCGGCFCFGRRPSRDRFVFKQFLGCYVII